MQSSGFKGGPSDGKVAPILIFLKNSEDSSMELPRTATSRLTEYVSGISRKILSEKVYVLFAKVMTLAGSCWLSDIHRTKITLKKVYVRKIRATMDTRRYMCDEQALVIVR